jgi:two-component system LytT family sensor kinase
MVTNARENQASAGRHLKQPPDGKQKPMYLPGNAASSLLAFLSDTSLLVVVAYLLARGPLLSLLFRDELTPHQALLLGLAMGAVGLLEAFFPDVRFSYATHTLFVTFAAIVGGLPVGFITAAVVSVGAFLYQTPILVTGTILAVIVSAFIGRAVRRVSVVPARLVLGFTAGALAQACRLGMHTILGGTTSLTFTHRWSSIPLNGFGVTLLLIVVSDAQARAESNRRRLESEHALSLASQAQLAALRARIHPHFLFNTLNSIAELCQIAPDRAEAAAVRLSQLMRRSLAVGTETAVSLGQELEAVRTYLDIEKERLGDRLRVQWHVEAGHEKALVPPFAVQILVENAVHHGIAPQMEPGAVTIQVRGSPRRILVSISDDGAGMPAAARRAVLCHYGESSHGLAIVQRQLILLYGRPARLHLFSREGRGTWITFALPRAGMLSVVRETRG